jgi:hypothetical protein
MTTEVSTADAALAAEAPQKNSGLFSDQQLTEMRHRWTEIQANFVDEPRDAVAKADTLVADALAGLTDGFARRRADLEGQWKRGDAISTEDLRQALRHYRTFFDRILSV